MKRVWKPSFLTAFLSVLLLAPALFQFDIQSAQAQNITIDSVEVYPEIVALEQTFTAVVNGRYEVTGGVGHALEVGIKNTLGEWVGGPSRYVIGGAEGLSTVRGEWQLTFEVAGLEYNGDEMGNCEVMSTPEGNLLRRRLFAYIVSPDTVFPFESKVNTGDPYVTIRDFLVIPHGGRRGDPIYAGEMVQAHIMVSVSPGGHWERVSGSMGWLWGLGSWELDPCRLVIRFRNTPDMAPTNLGCWDVGSWDGHRSYAYGEVIRHSLNLDLGFDIQAPDRPTDNWEWVFEARAEAEDTVRDEESFTIQVLERETNRIWIDDVVVVPDIAEPSQNLRVNIQGGYAFLEGETHNIILTVQNEYRREVRQLRDISGGGSFSEILNAVAPSTEGENIRLGVARAVIQGTDIDDEKEFYVTVRSGAAAERYCRITGVTVNGQTPPQQVTLGEDFTVGVTAEWSLPPEAERVHVGIAIPFEEGLILSITIVGDDLDPSVSPASISFNIDGSSLREILSRHDLPQGGRLGLQAFISYWVGHVQEAGEGREFDIIITGGEAEAAGGRSDWSITGVSVSPVDPFMGVGVTFTARIQVATSDPFPQTVGVSYAIDGVEQLRGPAIMEEGMTFLAVSSPPWTPTLGVHTVRWEVDPDHAYDDADRGNNVRELRFTVTQTPVLPGGQPAGEQPAGEEFDFYVTAVPTEQTVRSPVTYTVTVDITSGAPEPVQLELMGVPPGVSYYFNPPSGTPRYTSTLTVTAATNLPAGSYPMTIKASGGGKERYKPVTLIVEEGPDYRLSISPETVTAKPGEKAEFTVSVSSDSGYSRTVNLAASGIPGNVSWRLNPAASTPNFQSNLTLQLGEGVQPGLYTILVSGSGVEGKRAAATLRVERVIPREALETETKVNYLAAALLGLILAAVFGGGYLAYRRVRAGRAKAYCVECGARLSVGVSYCPKCGAKQPEQGG